MDRRLVGELRGPRREALHYRDGVVFLILRQIPWFDSSFDRVDFIGCRHHSTLSHSQSQDDPSAL